MSRFRHLLLLVVIVALLLAALPLATVAQEDDTPRTGLRPDAPPYGVRGPYWAGTMPLEIEDEERPLVGDMWYPALNPDALPEEHTYHAPQFGQAPIFGHALLAAPADTEHGPYPLVVFSHCAWCNRVAALYLVEHLATHGFVVLAVDAEDNNATSELPYNASLISRPADVTRLIDYATVLTAPGGALAGVIDVERVAVVGDMLGGYAALAAAGAQMDMAWHAEWCEEYAETDLKNMCPAVLENLDELAAMAGLEAVPDGLWPAMQDPRVDAIVPLNPNTRLLSDASLAPIEVPTLLLASGASRHGDLEANVIRPYHAISSAQKALVLFDLADIHIFIITTDAVPWIPAGMFHTVTDPVWDMARAHDLTDHFVTAFLLAELYDDAEAAAALAPEAVAFPGITYETTGF